MDRASATEPQHGRRNQNEKLMERSRLICDFFIESAAKRLESIGLTKGSALFVHSQSTQSTLSTIPLAEFQRRFPQKDWNKNASSTTILLWPNKILRSRRCCSRRFTALTPAPLE